MEMRKYQFNEKEDFQTLNIMLNGNKKKGKDCLRIYLQLGFFGSHYTHENTFSTNLAKTQMEIDDEKKTMCQISTSAKKNNFTKS